MISQTKAEAKSYDPMTLRHALDLAPNRTDAVSMLLWNAIYGSRNMKEFETRVEFAISKLHQALEKVRTL